MSDKEEFHRFSISLPKAQFEEFEAFRANYGINRSDAIRKAMRDYLIKETREEKLISDKFTTAVIIICLEHLWEGHDHDHTVLSTESHSVQHAEDDASHILMAHYFNYPDSDLIKINHLEHLYHDIVLTKMHVHSAHERCILIIPVKGSGKRINEFYQHVIQLKSVLSHDLIIEN
ncbi:MAG: hypothetical protein JW776_04570 [Candidatus Lokiarchaeota archaeon]|nr:hypothetical protein [Candidatus Lokiarchaeota archaeon]